MISVNGWRSLAAATFTIASIGLYYSHLSHHPFPVATRARQQEPLLPIPKQIWQINFDHPHYHDLGPAIHSWDHLNPQHNHAILTEATARDIIQKHYADDPKTLKTYLDLHSMILKSDYLRYLVLAAVGGVYSDLDTDAVKPIDEWIPPELAQRGIRAIVGIESDKMDGPNLVPGLYMPVQFAQWTLACSARHPMMVRMAEAVTRDLHLLAGSHGVPVHELEPMEAIEVLVTTGPVRWSRMVFDYLSEVSGTELTWKNVTGMTKSRVIGDVLVLPVAGFASGLGHSGSPREVTGDTLMWHRFQGTWRVGSKND
ncbi:MAG: hypothetical protein L6R35_005847 [Caloplaca aegaea]|nr:MAG: hypothetical protein L6R35_005847 [Caloplaca aegaea]